MKFEVSTQAITCLACEELVSGTVGQYRAEFVFGPEWAGLAATAVFRSVPYSGGASVERKAVLGPDGTCAVPHEVLTQGGRLLNAGVYGVDVTGRVVLPTVWCRVGYIAPGTPADASPGQDPTPTVAEQMTAEFAAARAEVGAGADRAEAAAIAAAERAEAVARDAGAAALAAAEAAENAGATAGDHAAAELAGRGAAEAMRLAELACAASDAARVAAETARTGAGTSATEAASAAQTATSKAAEAVQSAKDAADALTEAHKVLAQVVEAGNTTLAAIGAAGTGQVKAVNDAGTAKVKAVTDEGAKQVKAVQDKGAEQVAAVKTEGETQTANAKAEADRAQTERERIESLDVYTRTEADTLLAGKADQPYGELVTPASVDDSAGGLVVVDRMDGNTVQRAYVHAVGESTQSGTPAPDAPIPITPGLAGGKYQVRTHRGLYECTVPDGYGLGDVGDALVVDPVTETAKWVAEMGVQVFDGTETIETNAEWQSVGVYVSRPPYLAGGTWKPCRSSHFTSTKNSTSAINLMLGQCIMVSMFYFRTEITSGAEEVKAWMAEQKAAGTPVTLVYRLAAPVVTDIPLTKVTTSAAPVLSVAWVDYAPTPEVPVTPESAQTCRVVSTGENIWGGHRAEADILAATMSVRETYGGRDCIKLLGYNKTLIAPLHCEAGVQYAFSVEYNSENGAQVADSWASGFIVLHSDGSLGTFTPRSLVSGWATLTAVSAIGKTVIGILLSSANGDNYFSRIAVGTMQVVRLGVTGTVPYTGQAYDIPLPQALRNGDSVELVDGRYKQVVRTMRRVLDGTTTIANVMERDKTVRGLMAFGDGKIDNVNVNLLCDGFPVYPPDGVWLTDKEGICRIKQTNPAIQGVVLSVDKARLSSADAAGLAAWLVSHPVTVDYDLAEPQTIDLPDSTQALLRSMVAAPGVANVWFEGTVVPSMTARYRLDLTAWVKLVTQAKEQGVTAAYLSLVADEQGGTEQDLARIMQEQHATGAELDNIETQQAITDLMIGGLSHGF